MNLLLLPMLPFVLVLFLGEHFACKSILHRALNTVKTISIVATEQPLNYRNHGSVITLFC